MAIAVPHGPPIKRSGVDAKTALKLVTGALVDAQKTARPPFLLITRTGERWLNQLYRHEVISALKDILEKNPGLFAIVPNEDLQDAPKETEAMLAGFHSEKQWWKKWQEAPEDTPILIGFQDAFSNWCAAQIHKQNSSLKNLTETSRQKVWHVVEGIYQQFELSSNPKLTLHWVPASPVKDHSATQLALEFLENKDVVTRFKFHYHQYGGYVEVEIDIKEFFRIRDELLALYVSAHDANTADHEPAPVPSNPFAALNGLKWQDITIQFVNGHEARISANSTTATLDFKDMGFEDGRNRQPNSQWALMRLLADRKGQISWDDSEAADRIRKQKQLLSESLKDFFHLNEDPFHPYKNEKAYRIKLKLKAEGD
ncbi:MAG: hypothetical protein FJ145_19215 [Deltaproteobacteria bacterium]|nr:hypothetical protein [Deltaproteobacteria bacterium]